MEYIAEYSGKIKDLFFVEKETLCDSAITNQAFDIHAVNGLEGEPG